jgi:hypothetical protein
MAAHTRIFGSNLPTDPATDKVGSLISTGTEIDNFKTDIEERVGLDHYINNSTSSSDGAQDGRHKQLTMKKSAPAPTAKEDCGILYTKDDYGDTELFYKDDAISGNETQITKDGIINNGTLIQSLASVYREFSKITGTLGSSSWPNGSSTPSSTYSITGLDYPDATWNKNNSVVFASKIQQTNSFTVSYHDAYGVTQTDGNSTRSIKSRPFVRTIVAIHPPGDGIFQRFYWEGIYGGVGFHMGATVLFDDDNIKIYASPLFNSSTVILVLGKLA